MAVASNNQQVDKKPASSAPAQDSKKKADKKEGNFFTRLFKRIGKAFYNMYHELKKVTWPTKSALINYSLVVLAFLIIMGVIIGLFDFGAGSLIKLITGTKGS